MSETVTFLGMDVYGQGLFAALGALCLLIGCLLAFRSRGIRAVTASLFVVIGLPLGILLGRALYCALNYAIFTEEYENPLLMIRFWDGGLSLTGVLGGLILGLLIAVKAAGETLPRAADAAAAPLCLAMALIHRGECYTDLGGGKTVAESFLTEKLPFLFVKERMGVNYTLRMRVWLYEVLFCLALALLAWLLFRKWSKRPGRAALLTLTLYGCGMILLESLRDDGHMLLIFLRLEEVGACLWALLAMGLLLKETGSRKLPCWLCALLAMGGIALTEFGLDGRLAHWSCSMGGSYLVMLGCCALLALPALILSRKERKA